MKVKRFTAASMQKALKKVRDEMGPDAVILSNHRVSGGVEIIVAQNYQPVSANTPPYHAEDDLQDNPLPEPKFSKKLLSKIQTKSVEKKPSKAKPLSEKDQPQHFPQQAKTGNHQPPENPWPFLSDTDRQDVQDQLQLQDQLEQLKHQGHPIPTPASVSPSVSQEVAHSNKAELKNQLEKLKSKRKQKDSPDIEPKPKENVQLQSALHDIKQQRKDPNVGQNKLSESSPANNFEQLAHVAEIQANKQLISDVRSELHDLTEMLKTSSAMPASTNMSKNTNFVWKKFSPENALQAKLWGRLENMGFEDWLIFQLVRNLKSNEDEKKSWQNCLRDLTYHLNVCPGDQLKQGGIFALVGPTGAGKTTTLAKMAVKFTLEHTDAKVGLVTMDNYRLAAHDQLRTLGQILGVPVQVADQEHSLLHCIETLQECDLVLIDTAGLTPEHPMLKFQLDQLAALQGRIHTLLTLPATSNSRVLRRVYHNYKAACLTGCILSKTDEASSLGDVISVLLESNLDLSYVTDGQRIPDDFHRGNAKKLIKQLVHVAQQEQQMLQANNLAANAW